MPIISAKHKCPRCGRTWAMLVNTSRPDYQDDEEQMRQGKAYLETRCSQCQDQKKK